jgi:hypothetical protein
MGSIDAAPGRRAAWAFLAALAALRMLFAWHLPFDTDEAQHLHVVWAWTQGLLPYRDVFDNHAPLFQLLSAPLFAAIGENADVIRLMRLAVVPWYGLAHDVVRERAIDERIPCAREREAQRDEARQHEETRDERPPASAHGASPSVQARRSTAIGDVRAMRRVPAQPANATSAAAAATSRAS